MKLSILILIAALWVVPALAATPIPDADSPDAKVYVAKCSACHALPHPKRLYFEQWQHMLKLMYLRISERNMQPLSDEEQASILGYLKKHAR